MGKKKDLGILFIGNSHTYCNDLPRLVKRRAEEEDYSCRESRPEPEMYDGDGAHASHAGSEFAAKLIWEGIRIDLERKEAGNA